MAKKTENDLTLVRLFDAPRGVVFEAWTDEKRVAQWWGPEGFTNPVCKLDPKPKGSIYIEMRGPDGMTYPMDGFFEMIVKPEKLVFMTIPFQGKFEVRITATFEEENGKTKVTVEAVVIKSSPEFAAALAGMPIGWSQTLDRLGRYLKK